MISLMLGLALAGGAPALSAPHSTPVTLTLHAPAPPSMRSGALEYPISIGDLDLATPGGRAEALARAELGSARLCDWLAPGAGHGDCTRATIDRAALAPAGLVIARALRERALQRDGEPAAPPIATAADAAASLASRPASAN
jgi:hypothetical protein